MTFFFHDNQLGKFFCCLVFCLGCGRADKESSGSEELSSFSTAKVGLSGTNKGGDMTLKQALSKRRSTRSFSGRQVSTNEMLEILWAGQGQTSSRGFRTAPSAGATYPLEIHVVTPKGVFRYASDKNTMDQLTSDNRLAALSEAALSQKWVKEASFNVVIGGVVSRTARRYGERALRYVIFEAGAAAQNMQLMATSMGLGSVVVGAYDDGAVRKIAGLPDESIPIAIVSVGSVK